MHAASALANHDCAGQLSHYETANRGDAPLHIHPACICPLASAWVSYRWRCCFCLGSSMDLWDEPLCQNVLERRPHLLPVARPQKPEGKVSCVERWGPLCPVARGQASAITQYSGRMPDSLHHPPMSRTNSTNTSQNTEEGSADAAYRGGRKRGEGGG